MSLAKETEYNKFRAGREEEIKRLELQAQTFKSSMSKKASLLGIKNGTRVLDAGCGTGSFSRTIAKIVRPSVVSAVDVDHTFIEEARRLSESADVTNIEFAVGDVYDLEFPDQTFDVSYCSLLFPHLADPEKAASELIRVTRRGGYVASLDEGNLFIHPSGSLDKFFGLFGRLESWRNSTRSNGTIRAKSALNIRSLFLSHGLTGVIVYPIPIFASSAESFEQLRDLAEVPKQMIEIYKKEIVGQGFVTDGEYAEGLGQLKEWLERSDSFWLLLLLLTYGKVVE